MSAPATARGPGNGQPLAYTNGFARTNGTIPKNTNRASWAGADQKLSSEERSQARPLRYRLMKDLVAEAEEEMRFIVNVASIDSLLEKAETYASRAEADIGFKRLDKAYVQYVISSEILVNLIPRHKGYPDMMSRQGNRFIKYRQLSKRITSQHEIFEKIRDMIIQDNISSGIRPSSGTDTNRETLQSSPRPASLPNMSDFNSSYDSHQYRTEESTGRRSVNVVASARERPQVQPKPDRMHAPPVRPHNNASADVLAERFAQLRGASQNTAHVHLPYPSNRSSVDLYLPERSSASNDNPSSAPSRPLSPPAYQVGKPSGPRSMYPPTVTPPLPPKLPLDIRLAISLPRQPSPTYSPARNEPSLPSNILPRSSARYTSGNNGTSSQSYTKPFSYITPYPHDPSGHGPLAVTAPTRTTKSPRPPFQELPNSSAISAQELYDRLKKYDILVIDVRNREEFDDGHIFTKAIICVEPLSLRAGISGEDLEERLVVSPESEEILFKHRDEYDLVVYYDASTSNNHFLEGPLNISSAPALRALHECLYQFSHYKKLRRPPVVLLGGLNAWIDLVGPQALQTSRTAAQMGSARSKRSNNTANRSTHRITPVTANSSREVQRRRLHEYNPLNADEERVWREKARQEEVEPTEYQGQSDGDLESVSSQPDEALFPLAHSYEDFFRRFPEVSDTQQSMIGFNQGPPARPPPSLPSMPSIPAIPSRPPPAVPRPSYSGVSDRNSIPISPTSRQPSNVQLPLYTSRSMSYSQKLPRTGIVNFGVTCYMNATIQCLLATIPLSQIFLDNGWREHTQKNWKGSNGIMPEIYANLIRNLWKNEDRAVRPTSLRNFCARLKTDWGIDRQQDAKEFLEFLVDCLHEDLNTNWERRPLAPLTAEQELFRERLPVAKVSQLEWDRYTHREKSFISDLFAGQHASRLRCTTCGNTSTTYEAFYSISVEIPRSGRGDIHQCLRSYCQEERLSGDEVWKCPHCKREREATKRITLTRLPRVLIVHFKRFSASKTESARKVHTPIDFPLHGLAMEPYMASTRAEPNDLVGGGVPDDPAITPPFMYDAYAVMRHLGQTGNGGHYIALVKDPARGCWRKFDDTHATDFDPAKLRPEQRLQNEQAYIVFYMRSVAR
ncbi:ubiquitin-specific protease doa4 [Xylographa carneopallida]|nr:ubiquitin-specific protease doa4 [Xylographa carneopallida]